ncbi:hypothetical protein KUV85_14335 [Nocardioides panacisoli]|uniref:hypothetical protein n=1 Tax=Nocardioides panacisoli TaxID=627624 RepID=UPI001C63B591|nr:hypothetical protein [Nocardioides panacisoli]QYJ03496.1 hypothetical protein KUV85_14335 [Nocardioides panacisoli]
MLRILSLALAGLLALAPVAAIPQAAYASTAPQACEPFDIDNAKEVRAKLDAADTVFEGRVQSVAKVQTNGTAEFQHKVRVVTVYAGDLETEEPTTVVTFPRSDDGHGRMAGGTRHLFFANDRSDGSQVVDRCSGTTTLQQRLPDSRAALLDQLVAEEAESARDVALEEPSAGVSDAPSLKRLALPGALVSLVGLLALVLVVAVGARRAR